MQVLEDGMWNYFNRIENKNRIVHLRIIKLMKKYFMHYITILIFTF